MDQRLRLMQNQVRKDPYNILLLHQYISALEKSDNSLVIDRTELNKINIISLSRLEKIWFSILNRLNLSTADLAINVDTLDESGLIIDQDVIFKDQTLKLFKTMYLETGELTLLNGVSSRIYITAHLHKGPCTDVNTDFPGYCIPMIQCIFGSFLRPPNQPKETHRYDNTIDVRLNHDSEYPEAFEQALYQADSLTAWQVILESFFQTIEHFGRGNSWEQPNTDEIREFWNKSLASWISR